MSLTLLVGLLLVLSAIGYHQGRHRALALVGGTPRRLNSLPSYYGGYVALWCGLPALLVLVCWLILEPTILNLIVARALPTDMQSLSQADLKIALNTIRNIANGHGTASSPAMAEAVQYYVSVRETGFMALTVVLSSLAIGGMLLARRVIHPNLRARAQVEKVIKAFLLICSLIAILTTIGIAGSLIFESLRFFAHVSPIDFLFGLHWSPQTSIRSDQVGASGAFGFIPLFAGTLLISAIAMIVAVPLGLFAAIYLAEYAPAKFRSVAKPLLEVLAGIPTVVYGFFAALTMAPLLRQSGEAFGLPVSSESALVAGVVMGVMIIPFISSLSDDVITAVPHSLRQGSLGLGATKSETIKHVVIPAALPGIIGGVLLAISRAIGETMIVVMAAGLNANLTANPFEAVTTVTVQIVTLLVGDQEFDSPKTLAAFALGLVLFCVTLVLNVIALRVVRKYREKYD